VGDVDGDGIADLVYIEDTKVTLWISQGGNRWSEPIVIQGTPPVTDMDAVRMADMQGTGVAGILWSSDAVSMSRENMFFLDFTSGVKPYLLNEMNNHMGAITRVGYASSTRFYVEDEKKPETRWKTALPFPVLVVAKVEVVDRISGGKLTTEYSYHHGYWDGAEREFRGFGRVDQRDTEVFEEYHAPGLHPENHFETVDTEMFSPPLETRTWFHQGPIGDEFGGWEETDFSNEFWAEDPNVLTRPSEMVEFLKNMPRRARRDALRAMRGRILRTELYALDGTERQDRPYTVSEYLHGVMPLPVGEPLPENPEQWQNKVFFPQSLAQRVTQWERGDEPMTSFTFTHDYDKYGQPRSQIGIAVPRGRDFRVDAEAGEPYLATQTETTYAQRDCDDCYIIDRAARTTAYEILNDGSPALSDLLDAIKDDTALRNIIGQTLNFFDGPAFEGLPFGLLGDHGALTCSETLVLTEEILQESYMSGNVVLDPPEEPPYLALGAHPIWTDEYPQEFRDGLPELAGYIYHAGGAGSKYAAGYFTTTERRSYDFHDQQPGEQIRGLLKVTRDPLGRDTTIEYDDYDLLPTRVIDPANLTTEAIYDYRVFQPEVVTDQNGNRTAFAFTPLGLLERTAIMGKVGEEMGDTLDAPGTQLVHDFLAFAERGQPISVRTIQRVHHVQDTDVPLPEQDETIETVEYSDGFGRLLQTRTQAEDVTFGDPVFGGKVLPGDQDEQDETLADVVGRQRTPGDTPNVVVSGWQVYDNKGQVVEKYEPFFSTGWEYATPKDEERGQKVTMYYDPRGQVIRTINPDGSEQWAIYGIPADINNLDVYSPTPWEVYTYDENDNAGRTHPDGSAAFQHHWNTPASAVVDALGRTVKTIERNGPNQKADWYVTRYTYDIRGNLLTVTDALGRVAFRHVYDLANNALRIENMDAGIRRTILDAMGSITEQRDSKGALILNAYDVLNRPVRLWARDRAGEPVTLREHLFYGDSPDSGLSTAQAAAKNLLGMPFKHYDEAGLLLFETYDFKGDILEKVRQVISDDAILAVFPTPDETSPDWQIQPFRVDWHLPDGTTLGDHSSTLLDTTVYRASILYDALNRIKTLQYPEDVNGKRKVLSPHYNRAGALEQVELDGDLYVEHIAYNARGQRSLIAYGNGVMTRYSYDPKTFRLMRLRTEGYTNPEALIYHPAGDLLQDFAYEYDLAGNILAIHNRTPECGIPSQPDRMGRHFSYDPLYRLLEATGRECGTPPATPWDNGSRCTDINGTKGYRENYEYDPVGNMTSLKHNGGPNGFTRNYVIVPGGNRIAEMRVGEAVCAYTYDANGNLIRENTMRNFEWDYSDQMRVYRTQIEGAEPSVHTHYLYDAGGQRVKKLVCKQELHEVTVYVDGIFEYHCIVQGSATQKNNILHVMDDEKRIALVRVGSPFPGDATPAVKYHLGDHLGSSNVVIDGAGNWINREEYAPYGETSFGSFARKRYRFTGKERDEESSLYYYGARYYIPWVARWSKIDTDLLLNPTVPNSPQMVGDIKDGARASERHAFSLYVAFRDNPLNYVDLDGRSWKKWEVIFRVLFDLLFGQRGLVKKLPERTLLKTSYTGGPRPKPPELKLKPKPTPTPNTPFRGPPSEGKAPPPKVGGKVSPPSAKVPRASKVPRYLKIKQIFQPPKSGLGCGGALLLGFVWEYGTKEVFEEMLLKQEIMRSNTRGERIWQEIEEGTRRITGRVLFTGELEYAITR
jgi:RHS repeat-associated protein